MNRNKSSIDGFIPRRPGNQLGELHRVKNPNAAVKPINRALHTGNNISSDRVGVVRSGKEMRSGVQAPTSRGVGHNDLAKSLRNIDDESSQHAGKKSRRQRRKDDKKTNKKQKSKISRIIKWAAITIGVVLIGTVAFLAIKGVVAGGNVFNGNIFDIVKSEPLKEDTNGRSNFLLLGTSEDDPGHDAGYLTDSIMILSIDQKNKNAYTFSIPRDLYVNYGMSCIPGDRGKINVYFSCVSDGTDAASEQERLTKTQEFIGGIVGMDIQYGVHVNYTVMRDVVNAIGGKIDVTIDSRDPRGVMDSNFDWKCGKYSQRIKNCPPAGHYIDYPNGPVTLDAEHALYLAQARGDIAPTYGFEQSNFDRERNQQMIMVAIRDKALSAGTLTNLGKVTGLIDALGSNLRTDIETKEVRTLMDLGQSIQSQDIRSIDLYSTDNPIFTTGPIVGAGSSVYPKAGVFKYSGLRNYLQKQLTSDPVVREGANITVLNGSGVTGVAQSVADALEAKKFTVDEIANAPEGKYAPYEIYQIGTAKAATAAKLAEMYGVPIKTTKPPVSVTGATNFVIIVGVVPVSSR